MQCYAISYDLIGPNRDYEKIHKAIRDMGYFAKIHESLFVVKSSKTSHQIYEELVKSVDSNDKLLVINLGKDATWRCLSQEVTDWLKNNL